jgi:hypothetical protein
VERLAEEGDLIIRATKVAHERISAAVHLVLFGEGSPYRALQWEELSARSLGSPVLDESSEVTIDQEEESVVVPAVSSPPASPFSVQSRLVPYSSSSEE